MTGYVNIERLVDRYVERDGFDCVMPELFRFDMGADGVWLSDRHWLLPERVCLVSELFRITVVPTARAETCMRLLHGELQDSGGVFDACYAGELTRAGFTAKAAARSPAVHALVRDGHPVGLLMPHREATPMSAPLPVSRAVDALAAEIETFGLVEVSTAWDLAIRFDGAK